MLKPLTAIAALVVASALLVPTVSQAEDTSSVRVTYADLDLGSHVGQHTLQARIAGRPVPFACGTTPRSCSSAAKSEFVAATQLRARSRPTTPQ